MYVYVYVYGDPEGRGTTRSVVKIGEADVPRRVKRTSTVVKRTNKTSKIAIEVYPHLLVVSRRIRVAYVYVYVYGDPEGRGTTRRVVKIGEADFPRRANRTSMVAKRTSKNIQDRH